MTWFHAWRRAALDKLRKEPGVALVEALESASP